MTAPASRYGFALRSKHLSSTLAAAGLAALADTNRTAASRFSWPHTWNAPAQRDGCSRRYDDGDGAPIASSAGRLASRLAIIDSPVLVRPCRPVPPASRF